MKCANHVSCSDVKKDIWYPLRNGHGSKIHHRLRRICLDITIYWIILANRGIKIWTSLYWKLISTNSIGIVTSEANAISLNRVMETVTDQWENDRLHSWMMEYALVWHQMYPTCHILTPRWDVFPVLVEICRSPTDFHDHPRFWDTHRIDDSISLCPDTLWSLSGVFRPDSRFLI